MHLSLILYCCIMCEVDLSFHFGTKPGSNVECKESRHVLGIASTGSKRNSSACNLCAHSALWQLLSHLTYLWAGYAGCAVTGDAQTWCGCCMSRSRLGAAQPHSHGIDCEGSQASLVGRWETSLLTVAAFLHSLSSCCGLHPATYTWLVLEFFFFSRLFLPLIAVDALCATFKMRYLSCWRLAPGRRCPFYPRLQPAAFPCCTRRARGSEAPRPSPRPGPGSLLPAAPSSSPRCQTAAPEPCRCLLSGSGEADIDSPWLTIPTSSGTALCRCKPPGRRERGGQRAGSSRTGCHRQGELLLWVGAERAARPGTGTDRRGRCKITLNGFGAKSCCGLGKAGARRSRRRGLRGDTRAPSELPAPVASILPPWVGEIAGQWVSALL